ncbi:tubulin-like doman-containing protein [Haloarcula laminariae]|uniref:tubulin-like doman-containing protein n=1 Tax=Haloarcula laminariae TaxID=2961577 RepID=UPI0024050E1F|nr:tubulin-like doman-containing protein [Halomicroarcula sp. FL173]
MNFPDRIFTIGGAGKEIGYTILETDWILEGILEPRPNPQSLTVTIIDSAEGEENQDKQRIAEIRDRIDELETDLRDPDAGRTGSITVEYKLINENIQLSSSIDLLGDNAIPRIANGNGMDPANWWLQSDDINENLDFAKGVVRKRGLGKAIYYKAYAEDDSITSYIDLPQKGKIAVLAGLGGGTGSGILMDLVQHLKKRQRTAEISLFGILPNHTEGIEESTNAFAALSELEYSSLSDDNLFKDMILIPIDPTGWGGKTGDRIQTDQFLEELDQAITYLITSYYNTQNLEDPFANTPRYAPFTIGIPQVLRYRVEAINDARGTIREMLNTKEEGLEREEEIYDAVDRFLTKNYTDDVEPGVTELDEANLRDRLEQVEDLLEFELFTELNYESVSIFSEIIKDAKEESTELVDQISLIDTSIRTVDTSGDGVGTFVDNIDEHLASLLELELRLLARRKSILERRKAVDDNRIRNAIEFLITPSSDTSGPGVKLNRLESKLDDLQSQQTRVETNLESTEEELKELREEMTDEVHRLLGDWEEAVEPPLQQLRNCDQEGIESELRQLRNELERFSNRIINAESPEEVEGVQDREITQSLEELSRLFDAAGISFDETRRNIERSMTELKRARTAFIKMNREESTIESLTPWESSTKEEQEQGHKDFRVQTSKLGDKGVFDVGPPTGDFTAEVTFDPQSLLHDVNDQQETYEDTIVSALEQRVDDIDQQKIREIGSKLDANTAIDELRPIAEEAFWDDVGETDDLENQKAELEAELSDIEETIALYEPTIELFQSLSSRHDQWTDRLAKFRTQQNNYEEEVNTSSRTDDDYVYIKQIKPDDVFRATGNDDIAESDISTSQAEKQRIQNGLEELAENARNQQYSGLQRRKLSKGRSRYDETKLRVAILSRAIDQLPSEVLDFKETFSNAYNLGGGGKSVESPYTSWQRETGGPWDIGLSVFISGVFLDNIRKVVQPDGYFAGYQQKEESNSSTLIHHSYELEEGHYLRRNDTLNMENDDDVEFYLRDESEIVDDLLTNYIKQIDHTSQDD